MRAHQPIAIVVALAGASVLAIYFWLGQQQQTVILPLVEDCALHLESCSATLPQGGRIRIEIEPKKPSPSDPLRVQADFTDLQPGSVGLRFKGIDMNMGYLDQFVHELGPVETGANGASFSGPAGVFACSMSLMRWQVILRFDLDGSVYEIPFAFETRQKG